MPWRTRAKAYRKHEDELYERLVREAVSGKSSDMNTYVRKSPRYNHAERYVLQVGGGICEG